MKNDQVICPGALVKGGEENGIKAAMNVFKVQGARPGRTNPLG